MFIVYRVHIWRLKKHFNNIKHCNNLNDFRLHMHNLSKIQELNMLDYFLLIILVIVVIFTYK